MVLNRSKPIETAGMPPSYWYAGLENEKERTLQEYKVKGIPNGILKILQERVKTNFGAFGYYFPQIYDCSLL